jgi:hypothetical protein
MTRLGISAASVRTFGPNSRDSGWQTGSLVQTTSVSFTAARFRRHFQHLVGDVGTEDIFVLLERFIV